MLGEEMVEEFKKGMEALRRLKHLNVVELERCVSTPQP